MKQLLMKWISQEVTLIFRNNELDDETVPMKIKNCVNVQSEEHLTVNQGVAGSV